MSVRIQGTVGSETIIRELAPGVLKAGRGTGNDLVLADPSVSREHAEIILDQSGGRAAIQVRDLGSRNGTFINGTQVRDSAVARIGDRLRLGQVELTLSDPSVADAPAPGDEGRRPLTSASWSGALPPHSGAEHPSEVRSARLSGDGQVHASRSVRWEEIESLGGRRDLARTLLDALAETGNLLVRPRPEAELHDALLALVGRVVPARRVVLLLTPPGKTEGEVLPEVRAVRAAREDARELLVSQTLLRTVLQDRTTLLVNDARSDARFREQASIVASDLMSALVAPLFDNERVIGVLYADSDDPRLAFDPEWIRAFTLLANVIAVKLTNARLLENEREQQRMAQELATAARIQREMLPRTLPGIPGYALAARLTPCFEAGGDLYDAQPLAGGRCALSVGDVTGKGMGAALLMSHTLASMRILLEGEPPLGDAVTRLYRQTCQIAPIGNFVTLFLARLDPRTHVLEYANCGHNPPLVFGADGACRELEPTALALGMFPLEMLPPDSLRCATTELAPGELLCIFSDGIPEALRGEEFFGDERLVESVRRRLEQPVDQILDGVLEDLGGFLGDAPPSDDVTLLLVRRSSQSSRS